MNKKIAVIGAGIGGLTVAIALQKKGFEVQVYENAPAIKPLGAGLVLAANAVKAYQHIGIANEILSAGKILKKLFIKNADGQTLSETDSESFSKKIGTVNNFAIHRADLHQALLQQLQSSTLILNKQCTDFSQSAQAVELRFNDGTSANVHAVIAADGIHSVFRKKLIPESQPRYSGYTCWRATIENTTDVDMEITSETWGPGKRFGIVPLSKNRIYWFACLNAPQNSFEMKQARVTDLVSHFRNFHEPIIPILKATNNEQLIWGDIIDVKPIKKFAFGNIVLLGDAAHATTPNMGQGACMAIEDAVVLRNCLVANANVEEAFRSFERKRIERTTTIVNKSWTIGKMA